MALPLRHPVPGRIFLKTVPLSGWNKRSVSHLASGGQITARIVMLCGNAYLADIGLPQMKTRLAQVTSSILATKPLSQNMIRQILPTGAAVADCNAALNYYRIDAAGRMVFGGRASYSNIELGAVEPDLRRRMSAVFPLLADAETEKVWSGRIGITVSRVPHFGRTEDDIYFVQGFSGHGVALTGQAGSILAKAVIGDATQFDVMSSLSHIPFPGGPFRTPALALGMAGSRRDRLKTNLSKPVTRSQLYPPTAAERLFRPLRQSEHAGR